MSKDVKKDTSAKGADSPLKSLTLSSSLNKTPSHLSSKPLLLHPTPHGNPYVYVDQNVDYMSSGPAFPSYGPGVYGISPPFFDPRYFYAFPPPVYHKKTEIAKSIISSKDVKIVDAVSTRSPKLRQTCASIQAQMAANQIPLCLVQDSQGQLHQLVYTVPENLYEQYVNAAKKGFKVRIQSHLDQLISVADASKSTETFGRTVSVEDLELVKEGTLITKKTEKKSENVKHRTTNDDSYNRDKEIRVNIKIKETIDESKTPKATIKTHSIESPPTTTSLSDLATTKITSQSKLLKAESTRTLTQRESSLNQNNLPRQKSSHFERQKSPTSQNLTEVTSSSVNTLCLDRQAKQISTENKPEGTRLKVSSASTFNKSSIAVTSSEASSIMVYDNRPKSRDPMTKDRPKTPIPYTEMVEESNKSMPILSLIHPDKSVQSDFSEKFDFPSPLPSNSLGTDIAQDITSISDILLRNENDFIPRTEVEELLKCLKRKLEDNNITQDSSEKKKQRKICNESFLKQAFNNENSKTENLSLMSGNRNVMSQNRMCYLKSNSYDYDSLELLSPDVSEEGSPCNSVFSTSSLESENSINNVEFFSTNENTGNSHSGNSPPTHQRFEENFFVNSLSTNQNRLKDETSLLVTGTLSTVVTKDVVNHTQVDLEKESNENQDSFDIFEHLNNSCFQSSTTTMHSEQKTVGESKEDNTSSEFISFPDGQQAIDMDLFDHLWNELDSF